MRVLSLLLLLQCSTGGYAQVTSLSREADLFPSPFFGQDYILGQNTKVYCNDTTYRRTPEAMPFDFYGVENNRIYLRFKLHATWKKEYLIRAKYIKTNPISKNAADAEDDYPLFYIPLNSVKERFEYTYKGIEFGYLGLPLKIHPAIDTFSTSFSTDVGVGTYLGYQVGKVVFSQKQFSRYSLTTAAFAAPSIVALNGANLRTSSTNAAYSVLGLTVGGGIIFSLNNYEFGLVLATDWLDGRNAKTWIYNGQTWFGVSIGTALRRGKPN